METDNKTRKQIDSIINPYIRHFDLSVSCVLLAYDLKELSKLNPKNKIVPNQYRRCYKI